MDGVGVASVAEYLLTLNGMAGELLGTELVFEENNKTALGCMVATHIACANTSTHAFMVGIAPMLTVGLCVVHRCVFVHLAAARLDASVPRTKDSSLSCQRDVFVASHAPFECWDGQLPKSLTEQAEFIAPYRL